MSTHVPPTPVDVRPLLQGRPTYTDTLTPFLTSERSSTSSSQVDVYVSFPTPVQGPRTPIQGHVHVNTTDPDHNTFWGHTSQWTYIRHNPRTQMSSTGPLQTSLRTPPTSVTSISSTSLNSLLSLSPYHQVRVPLISEVKIQVPNPVDNVVVDPSEVPPLSFCSPLNLFTLETSVFWRP